jgi:hypothetical protein
MDYKAKKSTCADCGKTIDGKSRSYCKACKSVRARKYRKNHTATIEEQIRANARSYAKTYARRGIIEKTGVCRNCQTSVRVEFHHHDYSKPLEVIELCQDCHRGVHNGTVTLEGVAPACFTDIEIRPKKEVCACGNALRPNQQTCKSCHAGYMRTHRRGRRACRPSTFHFAEPDRPCTYWSNGDHIVADGVCRCGMRIRVVQINAQGAA